MGSDEEIFRVDPKTKAVLDKKGYIVLKKISEGAFGKVYKAKNKARNEPDAVKVMDLEKAAAKGLNEKFMDREIAALVNVRHPNVLYVHDIFKSKGRLYIFMEFAPNGTLDNRLKKAKNGFLKEAQAKIWFRQCVAALHCMHVDHHMCHRDIKLENVLLDAQDRCKLSDFGFAREFHLEDGKLSNTHCGTAPYYAPEIVAKQPYNPFLYDVWAMGVMLFRMLHGNYPFNVKNLKHNRAGVLNEMKAKSYNINEKAERKLSREVKVLLDKMFTFSPKNRLNIIGVKTDPWLNENDDEGGSAERSDD